MLAAIAVILSGSLWGIYWYPLRWLGEIGLGAGWVSFIFNVVAALVPLPFLFAKGARKDLTAGHMLTGLLLGTAFSLYTISLVMTDVVHAVLLFYLTPVWSTLAGLVWLKQRLTIPRAAAIVLGFIGVAFILGIDEGFPLPRNWGDWIAVASGMLWAIGSMRSFLKPATGAIVPTFAFAMGGLVSSGVIIVIGASLTAPLASPANIGLALPWVVALSLVIFVPPNFLVLWAAQRIDASRVGILLMSEVMVGAITAGLFSGEPFGIREAVGTVLIVLAALIEVLGRH